MKRRRSACAALVLLLIVGGCDPSVELFQDNGRDYSIFGYLNASADTQFVRVEPLRDGMLTRAPDSLNVDVTLTDLATDRTTVLQDSLFRFFNGATAHNFYTTRDIEPTASYRLAVHGPDGTESRVHTTVPATFPEPSIILPATYFPSECNDPYRENPQTVIEIRGMERLVAVKALYYGAAAGSYSHLADTVQTGNGVIEARVHYVDDLCGLSETLSIPERIEIVVAAGNADWPDFVTMDFETETLPGVASNVEGGTGLLGSVVTDTVVVYPYSYEDE